MFIFTPIYGDDAVEMVSVRFSCVSFGFTLSLSLSGLFFFSGSRPCGVDVDIGVSRCQRVIQKSKKKKKRSCSLRAYGTRSLLLLLIDEVLTHSWRLTTKNGRPMVCITSSLQRWVSTL